MTANGLSTVEARERLSRIGANEIRGKRHTGLARQVVQVLASPLTLLLLAASIVSAFVGARADALIIVTTVALGAALDVYQLIRSDSAMERLRAFVRATATAKRDGQWKEVPRREIVEGDLIRLESGDLVPGDAVLVSATHLNVQQAVVTGESLPIEKQTTESTTLTDIPIMAANDAVVLFGTSVVSGTGEAVVVATGQRTIYGDIAARLAAAPPPTELERGLRRFGALLARTIVSLALLLALLSIARHRDPIESMLFAVALAVGIVPEFMPMIMSVTLAAGAMHMSRRRVIVKHLGAIENIGGIDVLCSDKTGTLTAGQMSVERAGSPFADSDARVLELAGIAAHLESGVANPLDSAVRAAVPKPQAVEKIGEAPFDFERRRASLAAMIEGQSTLIVRGAPESVLGLCTRTRRANGEVAFDDATRRSVDDRIGRASSDGLRVLAVASRAIHDERIERALEADLTLEGWLEFSDPVLPDTAATVRALADDGVALKILTGDNEKVAKHVCAAAGIDVQDIVLGTDLDHVSDAALGPLAERTTLFARVSPSQKLRILLALKARGHVVGFLGDGVNDAPSLHAADVGISVPGAADVARDAAEIILLDRDLGCLHAGIIEGRRAFGNLMKYLLMATSSNFGNMLSMAAASLVVPFLPLLPTQILLNNFLYDVSQLAIPTDRVDDVFVRKPHHWDTRMLRRFMLRAGLISSVFDVVTFAALLLVFDAGPALFRTGWFVESLLTQTLVLLVVRTSQNALRASPRPALIACIGVAVIAGVALPYTPLSAALGFTPMPPAVAGFVALTTLLYLAAMEIAKRHIAPEIMGESSGESQAVSAATAMSPRAAPQQ